MNTHTYIYSYTCINNYKYIYLAMLFAVKVTRTQ